MTTEEDNQTDRLTLSQDLYLAKGWQQGSIFKLKGANELSLDVSNDEPTLKANFVSVDESALWIVASQDCDIIAEAERRIEALVCSIDEADRNRSRSLLRASAREYVVDWELGIIADARRRVMLEKRVLLTAEPLERKMSADERRSFANWLAWRFDRPPIDDTFVKEIQRPIADAIQRLERTSPIDLALFEQCTHDLRIQYPQPSMTTALLFVILNDGELSIEQANALDLVLSNVEAAVEKNKMFQIERYVEQYSTVTLRAYEATQPLRFDYLTRWGEELVEPRGVLRKIKNGAVTSVRQQNGTGAVA